jgi:hypothetical protein
MLLDAGFLIAIDDGERLANVFIATQRDDGVELHTTVPVVAQVWRDGSTQASLARLVKGLVLHDMSSEFDDHKRVGDLLKRSNTSDVVDAHLVVTAKRLGMNIVSGDPKDIKKLSESVGTPQPEFKSWRD